MMLLIDGEAGVIHDDLIPDDLCFVLTEDNSSFCGRELPCPVHVTDGEADA